MSRFCRAVRCWFTKHFYRPSYEMQYTQAGKRAPMRNRRYRYECECCGKKTKWMTNRAHEAFLDEFNPTWGPRGSDSQGRFTSSAD